MAEDVCIYTGTHFNTSTYEHILQASFGARWECNTLICQEMQELFSGAIDYAVADRIAMYRTLFGTQNGRKIDPPAIRNTTAADGTKYHLMPGMEPHLARGTYKLEKKDDGTVGVQFTVSDNRQFPELLARFKRENPDLKFEAPNLDEGVRSPSYLTGPLHLQSVIGGRDFFRGILKSAFNLLGVNRPDIAQDPAFTPLKNLIVHDKGDTDDFVRWVTSAEPLPIEAVGDIDHTLAVWNKDGEVFGLLQVFGDIPFLLKLAEGAKAEDLYFGYSVDPLRNAKPAESRNPKIDLSGIPSFADAPAKPEAFLRQAFASRLSRIMRKAHNASVEKQVERIVEGVLLPHDGKPFTQEMLDELSRRMGEFVAHLVTPAPLPGSTSLQS
jgi:hypothetical protein